VLRDVIDGKVSRLAAEHDYGVVLGSLDDELLRVDEERTAALRERRRHARTYPVFFDRGPGYPVLAGGATHADVDVLSADERAALKRWGEGERQRAGGWGSVGEGERERAGGWGMVGGDSS
jgi:hypothetical protein